MPKPINYRLTPAGPIGYGHRIWLPINNIDQSLRVAMDSLSMWGGSDKQNGEWISWEVHDIQLIQAISELKCRGFVELKTDTN